MLLAIGSLAGCKFEPQIPTLLFPTAPPQPFSGLAPGGGQVAERPEDAVDKLIDELFDPFNLPGDEPYEGSVYQQMDRVLSGAYAYYGHDLAELARNRQDNPLTEQMFFDYLVKTGWIYVPDPATGDQFSSYEWLQRRLGTGSAGVYSLVLDEIGDLDKNNPMNYEANYLAALFTAYLWEASRARQWFHDQLISLYGVDSAAMYEYLAKLDLLGPE